MKRLDLTTPARARIAVAIVGLLPELGCKGDAHVEPEPVPSTEISTIMQTPLSDACRDRNRPADASCCAHDYGFDPRVAMEACGFTGYVGEQRGLASCVHTFERGDERHRFDLEDFDGLDWKGTIELHESGLGPEFAVSTDTLGSGARVHWTRGAVSEWLIVPGWSRPRRVGWRTGSCTPEGMRRIAEHMSEAPERAPVLPPDAMPVQTPSSPVSDPADAASLLEAHAYRRPSDGPTGFHLPYRCTALVRELLIVAAAEDTSALPRLITPEARWGLPDRRQFDAHPVFGDDEGRRFLDHFRVAALRFPNRSLECPSGPRESTAQIESGKAAMWCYYAEETDSIVFRMRMHEGTAKLDYIGFFREVPSEPITLENALPPPPMFAADRASE